MSDPVTDYAGGLPEASGTFTGIFDTDAVADLLGPVPDLLPIEIDTYDKPNTARLCQPGETLTVTAGDEQWAFPVDHVEPLDGNRVRVWVRRPGG